MIKKKNDKKVIVKKAASKKTLSPVDLQELAHAGTEIAVKKLERYIETEPDQEKRTYAEMALAECEFMLYQPADEREEADLLLRSMIDRRKREIDRLTMDADSIRLRLDKIALEKKVHDKVLSGNVGKSKEWSSYYSDDFVIMSEIELREIGERMEYVEAWVAEADKMIRTQKYKTMPSAFLRYFDFDDETSDDEDSCCKYEGGCDCDGSCGDECAPF
ncbi:MAG: hypothetical protein WCL23_03490 [Candidatus Moraniibacteriota bacterium]